MSHLLALVLLAQSSGVRTTDANVGGADDVRGFRRGVDSLVYDPAAPAFGDGPELQYRQRISDGERAAFGAHAVFPGALTAGLGYDWFPGLNTSFERATVNLALRGPSVSFGATYQRYRVSRGGFDNSGVLNLGAFAEATRWLSLSAGVDAVNSPQVLGQRQRAAFRFGGSVRPLLGAPWLTLGGEARLPRGDEDTRVRAVAQVAYRDLQAFAAYDFAAEEGWFGLSFGFGGASARAGVGLPDADGADPIGAFAATFRADPEGPLLFEPDRDVEVVLRGDLRRGGGLFSGGELVSAIPLELDRLADDPRVRSVTLTIGALAIGSADLEGLRRSIARIRKAGKPVIAEIGYVDDRGYMLAAACDEIRADPAALIEVNGFAVTRRYYAAALARFGIRVSAAAVGDYKTGPHPYTRSDSTEQADEVIGEILDQLYSKLIGVLVDDRAKSEDEAKALIDRGLFTAQDAIDAGLIDGLIYPDDPTAVPEPRNRGTRMESLARPSRDWGRPPRVAVIPIVGTIAMNSSNPLAGESGTAQGLVPQLEAAMRDDSVKAVVLYVNSPGGEVVASDFIWRAIKRLAARKPVVTFMGNIATSGGYWVAMATDTIIAEESTLTGSIGIFQLKPDIEALYRMLDVTAKVDTRGKLAAIRSIDKGPSPHELAEVQKIIDKEYDRFIAKVAAGRGMEPSRVREIAGGRVYTGRRAKELGLVDEIAGFPRAVRLAAERGGLGFGEYAVEIATGSSQVTRTLGRLVEAEPPTDLIEAIEKSLERIRGVEDSSMAILPLEYEIEW
ncbi:MAG: signal peptide peptidase SppA [Myxococcota bacterium]